MKHWNCRGLGRNEKRCNAFCRYAAKKWWWDGCIADVWIMSHIFFRLATFHPEYTMLAICRKLPSSVIIAAAEEWNAKVWESYEAVAQTKIAFDWFLTFETCDLDIFNILNDCDCLAVDCFVSLYRSAYLSICLPHADRQRQSKSVVPITLFQFWFISSTFVYCNVLLFRFGWCIEGNKVWHCLLSLLYSKNYKFAISVFCEVGNVGAAIVCKESLQNSIAKLLRKTKKLKQLKLHVQSDCRTIEFENLAQRQRHSGVTLQWYDVRWRIRDIRDVRWRCDVN